MSQPKIMPKFQSKYNVPLVAAPAPRAEIDTSDDDEIVTRDSDQGPPPHGNGLTQNGLPDRRLKGQRDLPEAITNPDYIKPAAGFIDKEGVHRTANGKPDRRFSEVRTMSEEEANLKQAEFIIAQHSNNNSARQGNSK